MKPRTKARAVWQVAGLIAILSQAACADANRRPRGALSDAEFYAGFTEQDQVLARETVQRALETQLSHQADFWLNDTSGNAGAITPLRTFKTGTGVYCREYREVAFNASSGRIDRTRQACRNKAGTWRNSGE